MPTLTDEDIQKIVDALNSSIIKKCECGLDVEATTEMKHFFGRLKDLGGGDVREGIEVFSKAVNVVVKVKTCGEQIGGKVAVTVVIAIVTGITFLVGLGFMSWIKIKLNSG